jgi:hypothetical protein
MKNKLEKLRCAVSSWSIRSLHFNACKAAA